LNARRQAIRVSRPWNRSRFSRISHRNRSRLGALLGQTSEREKSACRAARDTQCMPRLNQPVFLHCGVVEVAENSLQLFQGPRG